MFGRKRLEEPANQRPYRLGLRRPGALDSESFLTDNYSIIIIDRKFSGNPKTVQHGKGAIMRRIVLSLAVVFVFLAPGAFAAIKPCDELKAEIESKLKEKGVKGYTLEIVPADQVKGEKVVGSCEGGSKKITYSRGGMKEKEEKK